MKTFILLTLSLFSTQMLSAQYCGGSGTFQCGSPGNATQPGFYPPSTQAAPLTNGVAVNRFVEFKNYDTLLFQGATLHMDSLVILSITNLPAGVCWSTNKPTNTFMNQEDGCILFSGTPCALPGQYKLNILVKLFTSLGLPLTTTADAAPLYYDMRLINSGELLQAVDTTQTSADSIILYGPASNCQPGPPTVSLGSNQSICNNSFLILDPIISGGTAPFTYSWQYSGNALSCTTCKNPSVTVTQGSTFTVAITDADNYTAVGQVTYSPTGTNNLLQLSSANTNINCSSSIDNTTINVTNGSLPLTLNWGDGSVPTTSAALNATHQYTVQGIYPVSVKDASGCISSAFDTVLNTGILITAGIVTRPNCWNMSTGGINLTATNGTAPYQYSWSNGATTNPVSSIVAGLYTVTVTDATACSASFSQYLSPLSDPWGYYMYLTPNDANCSNNGAVNAVINGGIAPYLYNWSNGSHTQSINNLGSGIYALTVTDSAGCQTTGSAQVTSSCYSEITGIAFIDSNNNCVFDTGDVPWSDLYLTAQSNSGIYYYGSVDYNGRYSIKVNETGTFTLSTNDIFGYSTCGNLTFCNNASHTVQVATLGDSVTNNNIGFAPSTGYNLGIHPGWTSANPGFTKQYWVYYYNTAATPYNGAVTITFVYDSNLVYQYSDETPAPVNDVSTHTLTWTTTLNNSNQNYGWTQLDAYFQVPVTLSLNKELQTDFRISPTSGDCDSSDNHCHYTEIVTGSHDPNEKTVEPAGPITASDSILTYTIHFQNTGTDSTHFVIIKDTLSSNLDPATVRNIASSDKYSDFSISGKGILTWTFNPLRIVDSMTNPSGSKRFISFTVKKRSNLIIGSTISNKASIYFDYNDAVVTNTVADTESLPTYIFEVNKNSSVSVKAFPNPFSDVTNIVVTGINEKFSFGLYDVTGRLQQGLSSINSNEFEVHKGTLAKGIYLYNIIVTNKPVAYGKLVVE